MPPAARGGFWRGVADGWRGCGFLLRHPSLWPWAVVPLVLNALLLAGCAWAAWQGFAPWLDARLDAWLAESAGWVRRGAQWGSILLFGLLIAVAIAMAFTPLAALVAAPFHDVLTEKVETLYAGMAPAPWSLPALARNAATALATGIRLSLRTMGLLALTLPLHLVPVVGSALAAAAGALITVGYLGLQLTAYSMDRRGYDYRQRRDFVRRHRARVGGLGAMAFVWMAMPGINLLLMPAAAVAGTMLFCDVEGARGDRSPPTGAAAAQGFNRPCPDRTP